MSDKYDLLLDAKTDLSGALNSPSSVPSSKIDKYDMLLDGGAGLQAPSSQGFAQNRESIEPGVMGETQPPEMKALGALNTVAAGYGTAQLAAALGKLGIKAGGKIGEFLTSGSKAAEMTPAPAVETAYEAGSTAQDAAKATTGAMKSASNANYAAVPQDVTFKPSGLQNEADSIVNEIKDLPKGDQPAKIRKLVASYQDLDSVSYGSASTIRSNLKDLAINGDGSEKMFAARLGKALENDMQTALPQTPLSQAPNMQAQDLRHLWVNNTRETLQDPSIEDLAMQHHYIDPSKVQAPGVLPQSNLTPTAGSPQASAQFANQYYRGMKDVTQHPIAQKILNSQPGDVAKSIFAKGSPDDVQAAKALLGDYGYAPMQQQLYSQLANAKDTGAAMAKYQPEFLNEALTPDHIQNLQTIDRLKKMAQLRNRASATTIGLIGAGGLLETGRRIAGR